MRTAVSTTAATVSFLIFYIGNRITTAAELGVLDYDPKLALKATYLSSAAYVLDPSCSKWEFPNSKCTNMLPGYEPYATFGTGKGLGTSAFAFVGVQHGNKDGEWGPGAGGGIIAGFKGSSDLGDFVADMSTLLLYDTPCIILTDSNGDAVDVISSTTISSANAAGDSVTETDDGITVTNLGMVHHGFCDYYKELNALGLGRTIASLADKYPTYRVLLTGHSLGGAAATVTAADLGARFNIERKRLVVITLGGPRVGDVDFAETLVSHVGSVFRIVHKRDLIPHLPPCCHDWFVANCSVRPTCPLHPPVEVHYNSNMKSGDGYIICSRENGEDSSCDKSLMLSLVDHFRYFGVFIDGFCAWSDEQATAAAASTTTSASSVSSPSRMELNTDLNHHPALIKKMAEVRALENDERVIATKEMLRQKDMLRAWWDGGI